MWGFDSLERMKQFAEYLSDNLAAVGEIEFLQRVKEFSYNSYTTQTEYLGEFRIVLNEILNSKGNLLSEETRQLIHEAIAAINKAFGQ